MQSIGNTSYRPLNANSIFNGTSSDTTGYARVRTIVTTDATGMLHLAFSMDNKIWDSSYNYSYPSVDISLGTAMIQTQNIDARYFKCSYTNYDIEQTSFRLQNNFY